VAGDDPDAVVHRPRRTRATMELPNCRYRTDRIPVFPVLSTLLKLQSSFSRVAIVRLTPEKYLRGGLNNPVSRNDRKGRLSDRTWTMNGRVTAAENLYPRCLPGQITHT